MGKIKSRWLIGFASLAAAIAIPVTMLASSAPASASTAYTIVGIESESVFGLQPGPGGGHDTEDTVAYTNEAPEPYLLINEGTDNCDGGTCWHFEDESTDQCLSWVGGDAPDAGYISELPCTGGASNTAEDFNNPPTNGTFGGWYSLGATKNANDGYLWGIVWDSSTKYLYTEAHPLDSNPNAAKWALNG